MIGSTKLNSGIGLLAFLITFFTALSRNLFLVSLERAVYAFIIFFLGTYAIRFLLSLVPTTSSQAKESVTGTHIDLVTPPDSENASKPSEPEEFKPLIVSRIETQEAEQNPAEIANMIRRLTDE